MTSNFWPDLFKLNNKVVVVTGAGLIGSKVINGLAEAGAKVIFTDINNDLGKKLETDYKLKNLNVKFYNIDIADETSINNLLDILTKNYGKIDSWINMAWPKMNYQNQKDMIFNFNSFKEDIKNHLGGYYLTSIKIAEIMRNQGYGSIINFSSIYGINAPDFSIYEGTDMFKEISYPANKGAINMLTKYIAALYGKHNVRANVIAPGGVYNNHPEKFVLNYIKRTPLNRMARAEDLIGPVIFLVSDASSYITGHILIVDGGWTIW